MVQPPPPAFCRGTEGRVLECCDTLGKCEDIICPVGFLPKQEEPEFCKHTRCEPKECCEELSQSMIAGVIGAQSRIPPQKSSTNRVSPNRSLWHLFMHMAVLCLLSWR